MKRFQFDLAKVLVLRVNREHEAELELGKAIGVLSELEMRIKNIAEEKIKAAGKRFTKGNGAVEIRNYDIYILRLDTTKDALLEAAAKAELVVEEARKTYMEVSRDRKVIDKLKERRRKEYNKMVLAEEVKMLDDISGGSVARKRVSGGMLVNTGV